MFSKYLGMVVKMFAALEVGKLYVVRTVGSVQCTPWHTVDSYTQFGIILYRNDSL